MSEGLESRLAAFQLLNGVYVDKRTLEQLEKRMVGFLPNQDQKFAMALAHATLKWDGALNRMIKQFVKPKIGHSERLILKLGMCQMVFMDGVADHAAIHSSVELSREVGIGHASKLINGVLRSMQRAKVSKHDYSKVETVSKWIARSLKEHYGNDSEMIVASMLEEPSVYVRKRRGNATDERLTVVKGLDGTYLVPKDLPLNHLEGWDDGAYIVQDISAQAPAHVLADLYNKQSLKGSVVDMCAAPGGKTVQLFDLLPDAEHVACELSEKRAKRMQENLERCKVKADVKVQDAGTLEGTYDAVLLDAPCSATGTTRRHPDVFFTRSKDGVKELTHLQEKLLGKAVDLVSKDGVVVYATCSLLPEENEKLIETFLEKNKSVELIDLSAYTWPSQIKAPMGGTLRLSPSKGGDGFFVAALRKVQ
ncbi:MAG: RsmB/NOP family class I SAM-dependent RNA methyltransferase [Pseudomonadota bacterium]|nr:RsmB/NOP family class I SAM-dependent RNA methyltransferase [Pseudomonadota bacterium]